MDPDDNNDDGSPMQEDPNTHELGPTEAPEGEDQIPGLNDDDGSKDDDEDQYFEDGTDVLYLPADHHLMQRVQAALTDQLTNEHERRDLQLREKEEELRKVKKKREETGVELYGVQHQLAKSQQQLEKVTDAYNIAVRYREDAESNQQSKQQEYRIKKEEVDEQEKKVTRA